FHDCCIFAWRHCDGEFFNELTIDSQSAGEFANSINVGSNKSASEIPPVLLGMCSLHSWEGYGNMASAAKGNTPAIVPVRNFSCRLEPNGKLDSPATMSQADCRKVASSRTAAAWQTQGARNIHD